MREDVIHRAKKKSFVEEALVDERDMSFWIGFLATTVAAALEARSLVSAHAVARHNLLEFLGFDVPFIPEEMQQRWRELASEESHMEEIDGDAVEIGEDGEPLPEDALPVVMPPAEATALVARGEISVAELVKQSAVIEMAMRDAMKKDIHYGTIPGVSKPTLLKPGAEKLLVLFRLTPSYESEKIWHDDGHLTVMVKCTLNHIPTGLKVSEGEGLCTTKESRYAWRKGERVCPECGEPQVREGKPRDGWPGNWYCWKKQGGCGATWPLEGEQAELFKAMETGRIPNPDLPDVYNTVLKMADKRALLAAVLNGTAASDVFTQDMEDKPRSGGGESSYDDGPYGGAGEPEPASARAFDPALDLRPDAPPSARGWKGISEMLNEVDPSLDWGNIIRQAISSIYPGDGDFRKLEGDARTQAARRTANAAGRITELFSQETFLSIESIQKAFAEMFQGVVVDVPEYRPEAILEKTEGESGPIGTANPDE